MSLKSMSKNDLLEKVKELESQVGQLEDEICDLQNGSECECMYENDMEITDLKNEKEELEERIEELETENQEFQDRIEELESRDFDTDELESIESDLEDAIHRLSCIRERAE